VVFYQLYFKLACTFDQVYRAKIEQ